MNLNMKTIVLLALIAAVLAQVDRQALRQVFEAADSDHDGSVELSEMQVFFDRTDPNKDGIVTLEEYALGHPGTSMQDIRQLFDYDDKMDGTIDDKISRSIATVAFNRLDTNNNGKVSFEEYETVVTKILAEIDAVVG